MTKICALLTIILAASLVSCGGSGGSNEFDEVTGDPASVPADNPSDDKIDDPTTEPMVKPGDNSGSDYTADANLQSYKISVTVKDMIGGGLVLRNNGTDDLSIPFDDSYTFSTALTEGEDYEITVSTPPYEPLQKCTVVNGTGTIAGKNVSDVEVGCALEWVQDAYLKASNPGGYDYFGDSVAMSEDFIVVGVPSEDGNGVGVINADGEHGVDINSCISSGAVYVFKRDESGNWIQDAYLKASNPDEQDFFGNSVAVDGDIIVVGAFSEDGNGVGVVNADGEHGADDAVIDRTGAAYVFKRDVSGNWIQDAYLKASNAGSSDRFGSTVAVSGDIIAVGAQWEDGNGTTVINSNGEHGADDVTVSNSGAIYVFKRDVSGDWIQDAYLKSSNAGISDMIGGAGLAVDGDTIVVGSAAEDGNGKEVVNTDGEHGTDDSWVGGSGAVYVFKRDDSGNWYQDAYLKASNADGDDNFGTSVDISGDTIVVGALYEDGNGTSVENIDSASGIDDVVVEDSGAVYIFRMDDAGDWYQDAYLKATNAGSLDYFGNSVAINGNVIVVGAEEEDGNDVAVDNLDSSAGVDNSVIESSGAAYVFKRDDDGNWIQDAYLKASNAESDDFFGFRVALGGDYAAVIAIQEDNADPGIDNVDGEHGVDEIELDFVGAGYIFKLTP